MLVVMPLHPCGDASPSSFSLFHGCHPDARPPTHHAPSSPRPPPLCRAHAFDSKGPIHAAVAAASPERVASLLLRMTTASARSVTLGWPSALTLATQMLATNQPVAQKWVCALVPDTML